MDSLKLSYTLPYLEKSSEMAISGFKTGSITKLICMCSDGTPSVTVHHT